MQILISVRQICTYLRRSAKTESRRPRAEHGAENTPGSDPRNIGDGTQRNEGNSLAHQGQDLSRNCQQLEWRHHGALLLKPLFAECQPWVPHAAWHRGTSAPLHVQCTREVWPDQIVKWLAQRTARPHARACGTLGSIHHRAVHQVVLPFSSCGGPAPNTAAHVARPTNGATALCNRLTSLGWSLRRVRSPLRHRNLCLAVGRCDLWSF